MATRLKSIERPADHYLVIRILAIAAFLATTAAADSVLRRGANGATKCRPVRRLGEIPALPAPHSLLPAMDELL